MKEGKRRDKNVQKLIDAARIIFIRKGLDNTTMSDIAQESGLCRRTLYSYFDNKMELYQAVVSYEMGKVVERLSYIASLDISAEQKVMQLVYAHFRVLKEVVDNNGTLRSYFFRNIWNLEHFRKDFDMKEKIILQGVIMDGKDRGLFDVVNVRQATEVLNCCMRGFEVPYISGRLWRGNSIDDIKRNAERIVFGILGYRPCSMTTTI